VAAVVATPVGDEIVLATDAIREEEVVPFGSAVGQAIQMAAAADEQQFEAPETRQTDRRELTPARMAAIGNPVQLSALTPPARMTLPPEPWRSLWQ
jgi:hypothetical protein